MMLTTSRVNRKTNHGAEKTLEQTDALHAVDDRAVSVPSYAAWILGHLAGVAAGSCSAAGWI